MAQNLDLLYGCVPPRYTNMFGNSTWKNSEDSGGIFISLFKTAIAASSIGADYPHAPAFLGREEQKKRRKQESRDRSNKACWVGLTWDLTEVA